MGQSFPFWAMKSPIPFQVIRELRVWQSRSTLNLEGKILGSGPIANCVRKPFGAGWVLVGDAGLHLDPWTGQGMDLASTHATYLAEALIDWFKGRRSEDAALRTYHGRRNETGLGVYEETVRLAQDLRQVFQD